MHAILKSYLKRLTNLSTSNRSLLLLRLSAEMDIDLHELDFLLNKPSFTLIENMISGRQEFPLVSFADSRNEKVNVASERLKKVQRADRFIFEERGSKDLFVGWPFIYGQLNDGTTVRCPLLFFPVDLKLADDKWVLVQREDAEITFNKSFLLAYSHYNDVALPEELIDHSFEDGDKDSKIFRTELYNLLKGSPLEINFNQDLFTDKLQTFRSFKKADYQELTKKGELILQPLAM